MHVGGGSAGWEGIPGGGQVKSMVLTVTLRVLLRPLPLDWLQRRQRTCPFSSVSSPPSDQGMMWSGSALLGRLPTV